MPQVNSVFCAFDVCECRDVTLEQRREAGRVSTLDQVVSPRGGHMALDRRAECDSGGKGIFSGGSPEDHPGVRRPVCSFLRCHICKDTVGTLCQIALNTNSSKLSEL